MRYIKCKWHSKIVRDNFISTFWRKNRAPVVAPPYFVPMDTANCWLNPLGVRQLWLNLLTKNIFAGTFTAAFVGFPTLFCGWAAQPNQRNKENYEKKIAPVERERARNSLIFRCWCKHQTPWCKRLKLKWKINFSTRQTFLPLSYANSYFLFSNFAVRNFISFTLDLNT